MSAITKYEEKSNYLQKLIDSKALPTHIKTVETAFLVDNMGKELGFPTIQAMHYIIPIQGRLTLSAKAIGALLRRNGVKMQTLEDAAWVYPNGDIKEVHAGDVQPVDRRTTILFTREGIEERVSYYWSDATSAGLVGKDNWKRMPREMLFSRALSKGANRIGQDFLLGLYSTDEIVDITEESKLKVTRDEDGFVKNIEEVEYTEA